jgi:protein-tyrosine phosphatase
MTLHVLHVCTGNICRSPMAERLMLDGLASRFGPDGFDVEVRGAGTYGGHEGEPMHGPAAQVLRERGVAPDGFTSTWLREEQVRWADLVLTATAEHRSAVLGLEPKALRRTFTLRELARLAREVEPAELPAGTPGERLAALAARAADLRATNPPSHRGADDVDDPFGEPIEAYREAAEEIATALDDVLARL